MVTKTFRAQNMLLALQEVQNEFGSDAMILSMREVPAGPFWATWRKPGVEIIASKAPKTNEPANTQQVDVNPKKVVSDKKNNVSSEELKQEIENLKKIVAGQKITQQPSNPFPSFSEQSFSSKELIQEKDSFDIDDFRKLPDDNEWINEPLLKKTEDLAARLSKEKLEVPTNKKLPTNLEEIKQHLIRQGVDSELVERIINTNIDSLSPSAINDLSRLKKFIIHQLSVYLTPTKKSLAFVPSKVMVLTGNSGSGKTSTCAKLASFYKMKMGKKVVWIEADTIKTSAISEARTYTETLDIPLYLAYTPQELSELILSQSDADLILVDTASCNPRNEDKVIELGSFLSTVPNGSAYLVASATTKIQDLLDEETTYKQFGLKGLIVTKTDETGSYGSIFNLAWKSKLPLFFFTTGNQIFGNILPGNHESLVTALFEEEFPRE